MSEDEMLMCLICFVLGFLVSRMMRGNGLSVGAKNKHHKNKHHKNKVSRDLKTLSKEDYSDKIKIDKKILKYDENENENENTDRLSTGAWIMCPQNNDSLVSNCNDLGFTYKCANHYEIDQNTGKKYDCTGFWSCTKNNEPCYYNGTEAGLDGKT